MSKMLFIYVMIKLIFIIHCLALPRSSEKLDVMDNIYQHIMETADPSDLICLKFISEMNKRSHGAVLKENDKPHHILKKMIYPKNIINGENQQYEYDDIEYLPEYTESVEATESREMRHLDSKKHFPICLSERKLIKLNTEEYEYRPAYYEEVRCFDSLVKEDGFPKDVCSSLGLSCVQWNKTIHLTRRHYNSDCWETRTMIIPAGCECMWPLHRLGEMKQNYNNNKSKTK